MTSSPASLDLSFIKSLFGSTNVAPTNSKPSPQSNNIPADPQQQQNHGTQQSPLVEQQHHDLTDRNKATISRIARSPPSSSQQSQVETGTLETTVTEPSKPSTQHCHNGPLTLSAAVPPSAPFTQQVPNNPSTSGPAPSPTPFAHQLPPGYSSTSQSSESRLLSQHQQKAKRKEGRRQRLQRTKQKQKMNQYNGKDESAPDLDFDGLLALHEKKMAPKTEVSPSAAISKQEATFVTNLLDSLSQSTTTTTADLSPSLSSKQAPHQPNPQKKRKQNQHDNKKKREGHGDLYAVQAMLSSDGQAPPTTNNPSMVDIAHDILGKPRTHAYQSKPPFNKRPHPSNGQEPHHKKHAPRTSDQICRFYTKGNCTSGTNCKFKHEGPQELTLCKFYKSGNCASGANCTFSHDLQVEPCRFFFANGGTCEAGDHCAFSHAPLTETSRKSLHRMTGPCRFYHFKGYCNNGDQCGFSHAEIKADEYKKLEQTLTPCKHFHNTGSCPKGDDCFFLHGEADPENVRQFKASLGPTGGKSIPKHPSFVPPSYPPPPPPPHMPAKPHDPRLPRDPRLANQHPPPF
ncbi:hypothetical protein [Absidia glauca]|uniref:C3H1-type domain-containing protein n=1 Tax=Absidia glauca TaxID=4829 RepID=A0A163JSS3_ABSGL|nr:hypothetical protein [Absidia glauca]